MEWAIANLPCLLTIDPKMMLLLETNLKVTDATVIFGEYRDYKTIIREQFASDLAHVLMSELSL